MSRMVDKHDLEKHDVEKHSKPWHLKFHLPSFSHDSHDSSPKISSKRLDFTKNIPTNIPYPPFVNVEGVPNYRDVGGYSCPPPSHLPADLGMNFSVRVGYAFRCSELSQITPKGIHTMTEELGIRTLYDFRSEREAANPRGQPKGVVCISTPVFRKGDVTYQMAVEQLTWSTAPDEPKDAGFSQGYVDWYRQILIYGAKHAYKVIFEHIRDQPNDPFVYHCTAGKDRTGVLTAVLLKLCGVSDEAVAWEYSLTVPGMGVWEEAVEQEMVGDSMMPIRSHGGMTRLEARRVCGSRASNMEQFLKVVLEGEIGGAVKYLKDHCGFSDADVEVIVSNLVVPGDAIVTPHNFPGYEAHAQT